MTVREYRVRAHNTKGELVSDVEVQALSVNDADIKFHIDNEVAGSYTLDIYELKATYQYNPAAKVHVEG